MRVNELTNIDRMILANPCTWVVPFLAITWIITQAIVIVVLYSTATVFDSTEINSILLISLATFAIDVVSFILFNYICKKQDRLKKRLMSKFVSDAKEIGNE